jgi:hypothetical protein
MKNKFLFCFLFLFALHLKSESSQFAIPQRLDPVGVYTKIRLDASAAENREKNVYEREKQGNIEGEVKFLNYFSFKLATQKTQWERSGSKTLTELDRLNVGLKFAMEHSLSFGALAWGGGVRWFDKQNSKYARDNVSPELYLLRTHFNLGLKIHSFEIIGNVQFQTESNRQFKEEANQEFRRNIQGSLALSYGFSEKFRGFLETEYRKPYNVEIDTKTKFWNVYPGISYQIYKGGFLGFSFQFPVTPDRLYDRGVRLSFYHVF